MSIYFPKSMDVLKVFCCIHLVLIRKGENNGRKTINHD